MSDLYVWINFPGIDNAENLCNNNVWQNLLKNIYNNNKRIVELFKEIKKYVRFLKKK
jgi:hypothetical protein